MEQMLIVQISSLSAIIILSIVLLVNSIKTKNKLVMYLSIGTLVVSIGCLTYCLIHHFNDEHKKKDEKTKEKQMKSSLKTLLTNLTSTGVFPQTMKNVKSCVTSKDTIDELYLYCKQQKITQADLDSEIAMMSSGKVNPLKVSEEEKKMEKLMFKAMFICLGEDEAMVKNLFGKKEEA